MVRLIDRPVMTISLHFGRKATKQQIVVGACLPAFKNQLFTSFFFYNPSNNKNNRF